MTKLTPEARANQTFRMIMDRSVLHIRVPDIRYVGVFIIGTAREMHAESGCCTCCWGRGAA